ncbi:hypothetical protein [Mycobacteroides abscessus]|uniref:hypothetical protein n=1 Tax=Mycobacteroides abscessus TaxID=36809 RepID=UPI0009A5DB9B|nr:hypothetical protein [Mycobacteroides abscessus]
MQPYEAITLVERVLRDLIREVMGDDWQNDPAIKIEELENKRSADFAKRRGIIASSDLIEYLEFHQLKRIVVRTTNWGKFEPALGKKKYFQTYMDRLEGFRNATMHGRPLFPFEQSLVVGIVGEITNQVTIWRSERGPDMKHYPEIISVTDSLGRQLKGDDPEMVSVRPGDCISFACVGSDPHGRVLTLGLRVKSTGGSMIWQTGAKGNEVTLCWNVIEGQVQDGADVWITLESNGQFHKHGDFDDRLYLAYDVLPPLGADLGSPSPSE